ncbi:MAG TPA: ATP-binding protein, partial [Polyangiaceae bacterium]|nr:ATP-binding protein [Polyangiaceae bacterium]
VESTCVAPPQEERRPLERWAELAPKAPAGGVRLQVCQRYARLLWEGRPAVIAPSFPHPPTIDEVVSLDANAPETSFARLRRACEERHGERASFPEQVRVLSDIGRGFGESPDGVPWRVATPGGKPVEAERFARATTYGGWVRHAWRGESSCDALGLSAQRCQQCQTLPRDSFYDCALEGSLSGAWTVRSRQTSGSAFGLFALVGLAAWGMRLRRARARFSGWGKRTRDRLSALGLPARLDPLRFVLPSRHDVLAVALPQEPAWERWGPLACIVRARGKQKIDDADVDRAAGLGHRFGSRVVFLLHDDDASLDLSAVRAVLDWAGKGGSRAMNVLAISASRLDWARNASDLLDLVEESSLRGNPFEVRGRITSSSQFWNRERLVSGLLAEARAGRWLVVTGLRRFGKSSLALEVARRIPGPSAYVDLAGFHHEVVFGEDRARAVSQILRSVCARLLDSARSLYEGAALPDPPSSEIDAAELTRWIRELSAAAAPFVTGRPPAMLVVLDELEQLLAVDPERLDHVLDVLAVLLGRLRNALGDAPHPEGGSPVSVLLCAAVHPLLWAPLATLAHQSIMGAFPSVCVPCLSDEAASAMMRGLGARQGIRFTDEALEHVVRESQGVPLLLRRMGTSLLELYDAEHARQGSLGAVQIGIEAAREAVAREEREGSPLRVWVESEIAEPSGPAGAMLRELAAKPSVSADALRAIAERHVVAKLGSSALGSRLSPEEARRRSQEAADVMVRLLGETGLLVPRGDLTAPDTYELPDGAIRRVLRAAGLSASPSAPRVR